MSIRGLRLFDRVHHIFTRHLYAPRPSITIRRDRDKT